MAKKAKEQPEVVLPVVAKCIRATSSARIFCRRGEVEDSYIGIILNDAAGRNSAIIERKIRLTVDSVKISYVVFARTSEVSFLQGSSFKDTNHGFFLMMEVGVYLFCFYSKAKMPIEKIESKYRRLDYESLINARIAGSVNLQKIRTKAMINTFDGCHNRTFEGQNLQSRLGSRANHRQILTSTNVRRGRRRSSVHFSLAKITDLGARRDMEEIIEWSSSIAKVLESTAEQVDPFLLTFAEECELPDSIEPCGILFHVWELEEYFDSSNGRLVSADGKALKDDQRDKILRDMSGPVELVKDTTKERSYGIWRNLDDEEKKRFVGRLSFSKNGVRLSLRGLRAVKFENEDGQEATLNALVAQGGHYSIVFDDPTYYYTDGRTVRDAEIVARARALLSIIHSSDAFDPEICTTENGETLDGESYPPESIFCVLDEALRFQNDTLLVCDDGPREWADFIEFSNGSSAELVLYHAKKGDSITRGASVFHVVVAQALKNLGYATRSASDFRTRLNAYWDTDERFGLSRLRSSSITSTKAERTISDCVGNPNVVRKVSLVVNFLSKADLEQFLEREDSFDEH